MKYFSHRETYKRFLLIFWTCHLLILIESQLHHKNVKVGLFSDRRNLEETSVENFLVDVDGLNRNTSLTKTSLQIKILSVHGLSYEEISRKFCSSVLQDNVTVLILQSRKEKLARFVGHLASYFKLPVIGTINQAPLPSDKVRKKRNIIYNFKFFFVRSNSTSTIVEYSWNPRKRSPISSKLWHALITPGNIF